LSALGTGRLYHQLRDPVPIVQEAGWAPGPVWTAAENLAPTGIRSPDRQARSVVAITISYPGPPPPHSAEVKNEWSRISTRHMPSWDSQAQRYIFLYLSLAVKNGLGRLFMAGEEPSGAGGRAYSVGEVSRGVYMFCFINQSATATAVQETRSWPSAWKFHRPKK
jgi:hypothetical protein